MDKLTSDFKEYLYARLQEPGAVVAYLNAALESDDPATFLIALRYVAEARGIANVAEVSGLNRESLYKMLSDQGNPRLSSVVALFGAIGVQLSVRPLSPRASDQDTEGELRPLLALVGNDKSYIAQLEDGNDTTHARDTEPAAA
jgi:probable addiction module antidote protein